MDTLPSNDFNEEPYFKWAVGLPEPGCPLVSEAFTYRGVQRHLRMSTHPNPYKTDWVSLYLISEDEDFQPHEMTVFVEAPSNKTVYFCRACVINAVQEITSYNQKEVWDYMRQYEWNNLTFVFLFPDQTDLKISKGVQNSRCNRDPSDLQILSSDFAKLLKDPSDHDVVLESEGELHYVHSEILWARLGTLADVFTGANTPSSRRIPPKIKVDFDKESLSSIVHFAYTGKFNTELDVDRAERLRKAAQSWGLEFLSQKSADVLVENLTPDNCLDILVNAEEDDDLKKRVVLYVLDKKIPLQKERWDDFCNDHCQLAMDVYRHFYESHIN